MLIVFPCPSCKQRLETEASAAGASISCPHCGLALQVPRLRPGPGATVGGFKIIRLIGVGGMGEVYLARQLSLDRDVALKIFPPDLSSDKERVRRFLNEIRLLARLEHPNIVTAHEAGEDDGVLFMAMAYVNGEPLDRMLERSGPLPEKRALQIARKIASALAYAWNEHKLLHRDIKPSNILLDARGEPKLADLGLSRTMDRRGSDAADEEILGTPNYMSPEQVEGRAETDCRSDMYSLGATLYHLLTGQLPFKAGSVMETLQKQLTESLPDPRVFNPALSEACVRLLEIMLAKDPRQRHPTWESLISDLDRVKAGKFPMRQLVLKGGSVLSRAKDEAALAEIRRLRMSAADLQKLNRASTASLHRSAERGVPWASLLALALLIGLAGFAVWGLLKTRSDGSSRPSPPTTAPDDVPDESSLLQERWQALRAETPKEPGDFDAYLRRLESFREEARGTPWAWEAGVRMREVREQRAAAVQSSWDELARQAAEKASTEGLPAALQFMASYDGPFAQDLESRRLEWVAERLRIEIERVAESESLEAAVQYAEQYDGPYAEALARQRREWVVGLRQRIAERDAARAAAGRAAFEKLRTDMALAILARDASAARAAYEQARSQLVEDTQRADADRMLALAEAVARMNDIVMESFRADQGRSISIGFIGGVETWEVIGVAGNRLSLRRPAGLGFVERSAGPDDLSPAEKFRRVGSDNSPQTELLRGLVVLSAGRPDAARRHFEAMGEPLGPVLAAQVEQLEARRLDQAARRALEGTLRIARQTLDDRPLEEIARAVRRTAYNNAEIAAIRSSLAAYRQAHAAAPFTREAEPLLQALENVHTMPREVDRSAVDAALDALRRSHPAVERINHTVTLKPEGVELSLAGNANLKNLSALSSLPLIQLVISGTSVSDLSPLRGLPLRSLDAGGCPLADLAPLAGAPLRIANFEGCPVENLAPLRGAPLEELNLRRTRVRSLAPLVGAPLKRLWLDDAPVESLDPLGGAPLTELSARGCSRIAGLSALQGMPLERLYLTGTSVADLRPLRGLPLTELSLGSTGVADISALKGLPLQSLAISYTRVNDLTPLAGLPLRRLEAAGLLDLRNIEPLRGLPLTSLILSGSPVQDLRPLSGSPLVELHLSRCPVEDLTPLVNSPIEVLLLDGCNQIRDYQPLMSLKQLTVLTVTADRERIHFLRRHPSLRQIGDRPENLRPAGEFFGDRPPIRRPRP